MRANRTLTVNDFIQRQPIKGAIYLAVEINPFSGQNPSRNLCSLIEDIEVCFAGAFDDIAKDLCHSLRSICRFDCLAEAREFMRDFGKVVAQNHNFGISATLYNDGRPVGKLGCPQHGGGNFTIN